MYGNNFFQFLENKWEFPYLSHSDLRLVHGLDNSSLLNTMMVQSNSRKVYRESSPTTKHPKVFSTGDKQLFATASLESCKENLAL